MNVPMQLYVVPEKICVIIDCFGQAIDKNFLYLNIAHIYQHEVWQFNFGWNNDSHLTP